MSARRFRDVAFAAFVGITTVQLAGCGMGRCIAEGTLISTPEGVRPIESLRVGDQVLSVGNAGDQVVSTVVSTRESTVRRALEVTLADGRSLIATSTHPVYANGRWIEAGSLPDNAMITTESGQALVASKRPIRRSTRVFDLTVSPCQNFFANGVLVHNKTVAMRPQQASLIGPWLHQSRDGRWYRFDLEANGQGQVSVITREYDWETRSGRFEAQSIEFISWSLSKYEIQIRFRYAGQPTILMVGHAREHEVVEYGYFELDGRIAERPQTFMAKFRALNPDFKAGD